MLTIAVYRQGAIPRAGDVLYAVAPSTDVLIVDKPKATAEKITPATASGAYPYPWDSRTNIPTAELAIYIPETVDPLVVIQAL